MKKIGILGSTGSVGKQTLEVIRAHPKDFKIEYLAANENVSLLIKQTNEFNPTSVCIFNKKKYETLKKNINAKNILTGSIGLTKVSTIKDIDIAVNAIDGYRGLQSTINIIKSGINLALSNKESIVQAGHIVMKLAKQNKVKIFPVDSEHSALWQCMEGEKKGNIKKLILTGSGGPLRGIDKKEFPNINKEMALNHPTWDMGEKISIDSATMMNKGFEVIEAFWLFGVELNKIKIVVHPQSLIHSMIEFVDGSIKAHISKPDMRQPIQYALSYPDRLPITKMDFNFNEYPRLDFESVDLKKFECISLAYEAIKKGGTYPTVLNVSNDLSVKLFLQNNISFDSIPKLIKWAMHNHSYISSPTLNDIKETTIWTEEFMKRYNEIA